MSNYRWTIDCQVAAHQIGLLIVKSCIVIDWHVAPSRIKLLIVASHQNIVTSNYWLLRQLSRWIELLISVELWHHIWLIVDYGYWVCLCIELVFNKSIDRTMQSLRMRSFCNNSASTKIAMVVRCIVRCTRCCCRRVGWTAMCTTSTLVKLQSTICIAERTWMTHHNWYHYWRMHYYYKRRFHFPPLGVTMVNVV